ncbi:MAG TPA: CheR family methyltransferase [Solirubrobacteraceae bacterium]|nr:CheR family methyltransferase [Solirubrobacteraceae bacterium]
MTTSAKGGATLDTVLEFVKEQRGFDFTGYKRSSIERRVTKRMSEVGVEGYDTYLDYLELHSEEFAELFKTILINVTRFFRDRPAWEYLADEVVPRLIETHDSSTPIRVWCPGAASGEEAYTVTMVLAQALGEVEFAERVKVYATDVDESALDIARHGAYLPRQIEDVPRDALERFFERTDQRYVFRKDLRRCVIFGRNDLVQDAPISRIDLLVCRNTLMYFTAETQAQILRRFHFALNNDGFLMLGKSEMLITHSDLFTPVNLKWRVFRKVARRAARERLRALAFDPNNGASQTIGSDLREAAFDTGGRAQLVLDSTGALVMANEEARRVFSLGVGDFGRPIQDLEVSYRPVELRSHLDTVQRELRAVALNGIRWRDGERERIFDVAATPLLADGTLIGVIVAYDDVSERYEIEEQLQASRRELEQAQEELQSAVEELETTNEELQSTNEELETTNEELQSTNEELETTNEELQSTNEELETMNEELRHRSIELNDMNLLLETVLSRIGLAVIVVDRQQNIRIWNSQARDLWGLTAEETEGQHLLSLDIGLPVTEIRPQLKAVFTGDSQREEVTVDAVNRRGREFQCQVTILRLGELREDGVGAAIMMVESGSD